MPHKPTRPAFTLIELLVVISVIAILIAMLLPALSKAKAVAKSTVCLTNQRQIGQTTAYYFNDYKFYFPASHDGTFNNNSFWFQKLAIGYLGVTATGFYADPIGNGKGAEKIFRCPEAPAQGENGITPSQIGYGINYLALTLLDWKYHDNTLGQSARLTELDNPAETIETGDAGTVLSYVIKPYEFYLPFISNDSYAPDTRHTERANFLMSDGHVVGLPADPAVVSSYPYWRVKK